VKRAENAGVENEGDRKIAQNTVTDVMAGNGVKSTREQQMKYGKQIPMA